MAKKIAGFTAAVTLSMTLMAGTEVGRAAEPAAWFGVKLPSPASDLSAPYMDTDKADFSAQPALFAKGSLSPELNGARLKEDLEKVVSYSFKSRAAGEYAWGRASGTPYYYELARWVESELKKAGIKDVKFEEFETSLARPTSAEVRVIGDTTFGAGTQDVILRSAMPTTERDTPTASMTGSVTGPLIYVGRGTDADLVGRNLKGAVAVVRSTPDPSIYSMADGRALQKLRENGAAGVIEIIEQPGNAQHYRTTCQGVGYCFRVGGEDGVFLESAIVKAAAAGKQITTRLSIAGKNETGVRSANVVAMLPGKTDRSVIIGAHGDGWFSAADDNGGGVAVFLALARHFAKQPPLERRLIFVLSAGHHSPGNGMVEFRKIHDKDYVPSADLILNIEHIAAAGVVRTVSNARDANYGREMLATTSDWPKEVGITNRAPYLIDLWGQASSCFGINVARKVTKDVPGELGRFTDLKIPLTQMISAGPGYQASNEVVSTVPAEALERAARFHAYFVREVGGASRDHLNGAAWTTPRTSCPPTP